MPCTVTPVRKQNLKIRQQPFCHLPHPPPPPAKQQKGSLPGLGKCTASQQPGPWDPPSGLNNTAKWRRNCFKNGSPSSFFIFVKNGTVEGKVGQCNSILATGTARRWGEGSTFVCGSHRGWSPRHGDRQLRSLLPFSEEWDFSTRLKMLTFFFGLFVFDCLLLFVTFLFLLTSLPVKIRSTASSL